MSKGAPDVSATFDIVDGQLENFDEAEKRLLEKRKKQRENKTQEAMQKTDGKNKTATPTSEMPAKPAAKKREPKGEVFRPSIVTRESRRNLTLKVLEENETKFNQLFHRLQLAGVSRRKQDLADEALDLLFTKYKSVTG
ncbi:hypothetical protein [Novipirellula artificiosorum]|uniref:Uncharacterized protein n=1 Tax=Novipirellula artificiosorum TaxID=2528016 RepID=A0A5C6DKN1_9BACT|nr:hypothetical protein [Novipirellula artificiosorum]TWU37420.1 hypothetical protein Poly41_35510 [Novipirellula artificiosorum]